MNRRTWWASFICLGLITGAARAQSTYEDEGVGRDRPAEEKPYDGVWFTQRQMELFLHRVTDDMAERYEFDEDQLYLTRETLKEHVLAFMNENRREIQPLLNRFLEAQIEDEPPSVEEVAEWAQRVLPLTHKFEDVVGDLTDDMREYLTEDQVIIMEGELAAFRVGWGLIENKVAVWSEGGFDAETEWRRGPNHRERKREERQKAHEAMQTAREQAIAQAKEQAKPSVAGKQKDPWARYVEEFVEKYQFTDEQRAKAYRTLSHISERRNNYIKRSLDDMERIEKLIDSAQTDQERKEAEARLTELNEPVERMFQQLKDDLQKLPTRAQRQAAAKAAIERAQRGDAERKKKPTSQPAAENPQD